jgi:DNA-3-methyladenine glycosylase II
MRNLKQALRHLENDPILKDLIHKFGPLNYKPNTDYFLSLVSTIIGQQLSNKAADTIYSRFESLFPSRKYSPQDILSTPLETLRSIGTSWAKARSLHDLSQKIINGSLQLDKLEIMQDEEIIEHLVQVKGIGRWTAQMKLMFTFHRPDILPLDDVGIQNAMVKHYQLNRQHKNFKNRMEKIANPWRPYRTIACWYLWKSLDNEPVK